MYEVWAKFGIKVLPSVSIVGDTKFISEFIGQEAEIFGRFPVNSPDCMTNDRIVNNSCKNLLGGLYSTFQKRKPPRRTLEGFINDIYSSWDKLSQQKTQNVH